jgi:hypothetical protein
MEVAVDLTSKLNTSISLTSARHSAASEVEKLELKLRHKHTRPREWTVYGRCSVTAVTDTTHLAMELEEP